MAVREGAEDVSELQLPDNRSPRKVVVRKLISKHAGTLVKRADKHEKLINKVKYCLGVFFFGTFCYLLGSRPQDIPYLYCTFFITVAPLRWIYYRMRKWHYYLFDFCYYANAIFMIMLLCCPSNKRLFMVCFAFAEGPLAWALIIWRCSLVFSSIDKIISVLIHLLPGLVFFIIRWWDPSTFPLHSSEVTGPWPAWPLVESSSALWTWLFVVPLIVYTVWQVLYFLIVNGLRRQRLLNDPEIMTSYRELSRKASKANNIWWRISGILGDQYRIVMYAVLQALLTVATMALTVPMFKSYRLHTAFELLKVAAAIWNGGNFLFEVMPRQADAKKRKRAMEVLEVRESGANKKQEMNGNTFAVPPEEEAPATTDGSSPVICAMCRKMSSHNIKEDMKFALESGSDEALEVVDHHEAGDGLEQGDHHDGRDGNHVRFRKRGLATATTEG